MGNWLLLTRYVDYLNMEAAMLVCANVHVLII